MRKYIFISFGCFGGAILRYLIEKIPIFETENIFFINTLVINILGAFIISFLLTLFFEVLIVKPEIRLGLTTGFLGAFTTFSTMCKEAATLIKSSNYLGAFFYLTISTLFGLIAAYLGFFLAKKIESKAILKN